MSYVCGCGVIGCTRCSTTSARSVLPLPVQEPRFDKFARAAYYAYRFKMREAFPDDYPQAEPFAMLDAREQDAWRHVADAVTQDRSTDE